MKSVYFNSKSLQQRSVSVYLWLWQGHFQYGNCDNKSLKKTAKVHYWEY